MQTKGKSVRKFFLVWLMVLCVIGMNLNSVSAYQENSSDGKNQQSEQNQQSDDNHQNDGSQGGQNQDQSAGNNDTYPGQTDDKDSQVSFERDSDGRPIFDGNPDHLDAFVDLILDDMTLEEKAIYAVHRYSSGGLLISKGYILPSGKGEVDAVQGVFTDFPTMNGLGQSWNLDLLEDVGDIIGTERRGEVENGDFTMMYSAVGDSRSNPLAGRYEEDFSEDPDMVGDMISAMAEGITGANDEDNEGGFWLKVGLGTKHYANYAAEWFRKLGSYYTSVRGYMEQQLKGFLEATEDGSISGYMTSYGRTNGVPNAASPYISLGEDADSTYTLWNVADFMGEDSLISDSGNGYDDVYCPDSAHAAALLMLSGSTENSTGGTAANGTDTINESSDSNISPDDIVQAVEEGIWGVTEDDLDECIRGLFEIFVRTGCFSEDEDGDGAPDDYVFGDLALGANGSDTESDYEDEALEEENSQEIALQSAQESIVLLKNDGVLPLKSYEVTTSSPLNVYGSFADARFKSVYSADTPNIENSGLTPLSGIRTYLDDEDEDKVIFDSAEQEFALKSVSTGDYVTASTSGSAITVTSSSIGEDETFKAYSWGQLGYSFLSLANDKWLTTSSTTIKNTGTESLSVGTTVWNDNGTETSSSMPERYRVEENDDGTISILSDTYKESFSGGYETAYSSGTVWEASDDGTLETSAGATDDRTEDMKFEKEVLSEAGENVEVTEDGYAIVVVGIPTQHSAGEGADRSDLAMGDEQYELVENIAAQYPKKTIVIVKSDAPVLMESIQNNKNVGAILYQPYAGQYDGYALAQVLFGDVSPSGHLTGTWYSSMDVLPEIREESLPEGEDYTLDDIDPRITVDYTDNDAIDTGLTYMYYEGNQVTYPFGYGLTYTDFDYSKMKVDQNVQEGSFDVTVTVKNTGKVAASDVVQIYAEPESSAYEDACYDKKLVGYEKVFLKAGESRKVTVSCDTESLELYDVNAQSMIVESGKYKIYLGESSADERLTSQINIQGSEIATETYEEPQNLYEHVYKTSDVIYSEVSKGKTAEYDFGAFAVTATESGVKEGTSWVAVPEVDLDDATSVQIKASTSSDDALVEIHLDDKDGPLLAECQLSDTGSTTGDIIYTGDIDEEDEETYTEPAYELFTAKLLKNVQGTHNLYFVFKNAVSRIDTVSLTSEDSFTNPWEINVDIYPDDRGRCQDQVDAKTSEYDQGSSQKQDNNQNSGSSQKQDKSQNQGNNSKQQY